MQFLTFILVYPFIWILARLPFRILYILSDFIYFFIYYIIRYRRKVVHNNLRLAFPHKSPVEISKLAKRHYHHLIDLFLEMLKTWPMSKQQLNKHFNYKNIDVLNQLYKQNKSIILISGHYGNWEWLGNMEEFIHHKGHAIYKPIKNKYFNRFIRNIRAKFGGTPVDKNNIVKTFIKNQKAQVLGLYLMVADQSPKLEFTRHWASFMGIKVPVFVGSEVLAKKLNAALVFLDVKKIKRGYYEASFKVLDAQPNNLPDYSVTDLFLRELEKQIRVKPEYYFWTHKRFKHMDKQPVAVSGR